MREKMNDKAMKGMFTPIFGYFPNKEVKEGDSWEKNFVATSFFGPTNCNSKYTVKKIEGDLITLEVETNEKPMISAIGAVKKVIQPVQLLKPVSWSLTAGSGLLVTVRILELETSIITVQGIDNKIKGKKSYEGNDEVI